jgi:hypothetical protein
MIASTGWALYRGTLAVVIPLRSKGRSTSRLRILSVWALRFHFSRNLAKNRVIACSRSFLDEKRDVFNRNFALFDFIYLFIYLFKNI